MADDVFAVAGVDDLYALDPKEFVAARDALAKRLREGGDRDTAAQVKKLARPTVAAWALNQVARRRPDDVDELLRLGTAVREGQATALAEGDPSSLREAAAARRDVVRRLAVAAGELAGDAHADEAAATLEAASVDEGVAADLRAGRLQKALPPPSGFGFSGMPELADPAQRPRRPDRRTVERLERELRKAEQGVGKAEEQAELARDRLDEAERALRSAEADLDGARAERDRAAEALTEAQGRQ